MNETTIEKLIKENSDLSYKLGELTGIINLLYENPELFKNNKPEVVLESLVEAANI